ncbi:hypothetical protein HZY86_04335 [Aerococcaceae bacterium DSM 111020]|nr:hypothetical protein [Aerococcaceae bacterium DSM 111020]
MANALIQEYQQEMDKESQETLIEQWLNEAHYNEQRFEQLKEFAIYYEQLGYVELALMIFLRLQTIDPQTTLITLIAEAYAHIYEYEKALHWLKLIPEQDMDENIRYQQSLWLIEIDKTEEAKNILMQLVKEFPTYADPYFLLADYYESQGDSKRALTYVEALYEYFSDLTIRNQARQKIVTIKLSQEQIPLAELEALMTDNELPLISAHDYYLLAYIYRLSQRNDLAEQYVKQSLAIEPNNPKAIELLVELEKNTDAHDKNQIIDWFQENVPESEISPLELASISSEQTLHKDFIQRLIGYLAYSVDLEEQYQIIRVVFDHFLSNNDFEGFNDFLKVHASNYLSTDELSYFIGKKAFMQNNFNDAIEYLQIARDYLIPEQDLIELLVKSYEGINERDTAEQLAKEYYDTEYQTIYLGRMIRRSIE